MNLKEQMLSKLEEIRHLIETDEPTNSAREYPWLVDFSRIETNAAFAEYERKHGYSNLLETKVLAQMIEDIEGSDCGDELLEAYNALRPNVEDWSDEALLLAEECEFEPVDLD